MKLYRLHGTVTLVGNCSCGKQWNPPTAAITVATLTDVRAWATDHGYHLILDDPEPEDAT